MTKKRGLQLALLVVALSVFLVLSRSWPRDQTVRIILGDAAPRVEELRVQIAKDLGTPDEDWTGGATFYFPKNDAPRIVSHSVRLPNGAYTVEVELLVATAERRLAQNDRITVRRRVTLDADGATAIDVAEAVPK